MRSTNHLAPRHTISSTPRYLVPLPTNKLGMVSIQKATNSLFRCNVLRLSQTAPLIFHNIYYLASQLSQDSFHPIFRVHQEIQTSPSHPSGMFVSIRLHTKQSVLQNIEHQSQLRSHQHRSLHILSPKMKTLETGQYQPQSRNYRRCISHIHSKLSGPVLGLRQLIVSVMSLAGTGSTQLQLHYCHSLKTVTFLQ